MTVPLFDYHLDLLIQVSMVGASPASDICGDELICMAKCGFLRSDDLGNFLPTKAAELVVAANILGGDDLPASASGGAAASETEEGAPPGSP